MLTAGEKNLASPWAFRKLLSGNPGAYGPLHVVRLALARLAAEHSFVDFVEFEPPTGGGWLSCNKLFVCVSRVLIRAYSTAFSRTQALPSNLVKEALLGEDFGPQSNQELDRRCRPLWDRQTLVVLHGPTTQAAAIDLESKFSEAALGGVQLADYRNFAHARHHWQAKRGDDTGIRACITDDHRELAEALPCSCCCLVSQSSG